MANGFKSGGDLGTAIRVGRYLAWRDLKRGSKWTTLLIVAVMVLTFLNLIAVSGVLVGIIEGAVVTIKEAYLGDIFISRLDHRPYIDQTPIVTRTAEQIPGVQAISARYVQGGQIESEWRISRRPTDVKQVVPTSFVGINPAAEDAVTGLSKKVIEGEFLQPNDYDEVLLGSLLLHQYLQFDSPLFPVLKDVQVGSKIRISINGATREVRVKGILRTKADEIDRRVFFTETQLRGLIGRYDYNADEIAVRLSPGVDPLLVKQALLANNLDRLAKIQTAEEGEPKFIKDMKETFRTLGNFIGSIGIAVAGITIFIIVFVNAITRRRFIGILKGIGISPLAIEISYVIQASFYALSGVFIGTAITFLLLVPYFVAHPIQFPFSDGILVVTPVEAAVKGLILIVVTMAAGLIPARLITKQNTLDAILGR